MPLGVFANRHRQINVCIHQSAYGVAGKEGNVHRREQNRVALVLQMRQTDFCRDKHIGGFIMFVAQEHQAVAGKMAFKGIGIKAGDHHNVLRACLTQGGNHTLCNGNRPDIEHWLEIPHARTHACSHYHGADYTLAAHNTLTASPTLAKPSSKTRAKMPFCVITQRLVLFSGI